MKKSHITNNSKKVTHGQWHDLNFKLKIVIEAVAMNNNRVAFLSICSLLNLLFRGNLETLYSVA